MVGYAIQPLTHPLCIPIYLLVVIIQFIQRTHMHSLTLILYPYSPPLSSFIPFLVLLSH